MPDDIDPAFLGLKRIWQEPDDHVIDSFVERAFVGKGLHVSLAAVVVNIIEADACLLHHGHTDGPVVKS